jgi:hypothetical protein
MQRHGAGVVGYFVLYRGVLAACLVMAALSAAQLYFNFIGGRMEPIIKATGNLASYLAVLS